MYTIGRLRKFVYTIGKKSSWYTKAKGGKLDAFLDNFPFSFTKHKNNFLITDYKYSGAVSMGVPGEIAGLYKAWLQHIWLNAMENFVQASY